MNDTSRAFANASTPWTSADQAAVGSRAARAASRQGQSRGGLPSRTGGAGAARHPQEQSRSAVRRGARAPVHRDHVGMPGAGRLADDRLPRPAGYLQPGSRIQAFRRTCGHGSVRLYRRGVPPGGDRRGRLRGGAGREFHGRRDWTHARSAARDPVEDLRRGDAADPPVPDEQGKQVERHPQGLFAHAEPCAVPAMARARLPQGNARR